MKNPTRLALDETPVEQRGNLNIMARDIKDGQFFENAQGKLYRCSTMYPSGRMIRGFVVYKTGNHLVFSAEIDVRLQENDRVTIRDDLRVAWRMQISDGIYQPN